MTALCKKDTGVHPIAVGEVYRRLASCLCCAAVKCELPDLFLPYGQVGVGVKGGLEAAIHALRFYIDEHCHEEDVCLLKIDMKNAFN